RWFTNDTLPAYPVLSSVIPYLDDGFTLVSGTSPGRPLTLLWGTIGDRLAYLHLDRMHLSEYVHAESPNAIQTAWTEFIQTLRNGTIDRLFIDLRSNPGGNFADLPLLLSPLLETPLYLGFLQWKVGPRPTEVSSWAALTLPPQEPNRPFTGRVPVLTDRYTASIAEICALGVQRLEQGWVVGEPTYGATGMQLDLGLPYTSVQHWDPYLKVSLSDHRFLTGQPESLEGRGLRPDFPVARTGNATSLPQDPFLETAFTQTR
ncbi:MAG: S41 family peptidase, partial [Bacteroidota bacterium]